MMIFCQQQMRMFDIPAKWKAFGWDVKEIDGHNMEEIIEGESNSWMIQTMAHRFSLHTLSKARCIVHGRQPVVPWCGSPTMSSMLLQ